MSGMDLSKFPCYECLILPICKSKVETEYNKVDMNLSTYFISLKIILVLMNCSIFYSYIKPFFERSFESDAQIQTILQFFVNNQNTTIKNIDIYI